MSDQLPEYVYLITVDGEWPVSAIADDHPTTAERVTKEVTRRTTGQNVQARSRAHVWRVPVSDAVEMKLIPAQAIPAALEEATASPSEACART